MAAQTNRSKPAASAKGGSKASTQATNAVRKTPRRRGVAAVVCFLLAAFSVIGYFNQDGVFIGFFADLLKGLVGYGFFALAPALFLCAVILCFHRGRPVRLRVVCTLLLTVVVGGMVHLFSETPEYELSFAMFMQLWNDGRELNSGGAAGGSLSELFMWLFGSAGAAIVFVCMALFFILSSLNKTIVDLVDAFRNRERRQYIPEPEPEYERRPQKRAAPQPQQPPRRKKIIDIPIDDVESKPEHFQEPPKENYFKSDPRVKTPDQLVTEQTVKAHEEKPAAAEIETPEIPEVSAEFDGKSPESEGMSAKNEDAAPEVEQPPESFEEISGKPAETHDYFEPPAVNTESGLPYIFPPLTLLAAGNPNSQHDGIDEVIENSKRLEAAFNSFGVKVRISNSTRGPSVTRYEAELEAGVKLNKLTNLADDIALSLGTSGVRIAAMPNMISTVGIEVPNKIISTVYLRDIIGSPAFTQAKPKLTFAIGMDISGEAIVGNISKLPHMLVAGTTGSGKSVCLNSLILSILYKAKPDDVRFIMIDPKMVEFKVYNSIPHLLVPVVTDTKKASGALQWAVVEMMKRYTLFSETNARDLEGYNKAAHKSDDREPLPQIVVVIDELADLMLTAAKEVEESICRVAQMGRAAGVHLIIATQSPRADVITGLMKANIPSRIALKVSSALESRIILDAGGNADKLVGNGDMLYAPIGTSKPMRIQGTWVSDSERESVVEHIKKSGETQYSEEVMNEIEKAAAEKPSGEKAKDESDGSDYDDLLPQAVDVIFETGQASVSMLQRRLKLGYSRAARIVDQMEQIGVVGPFEGSKPRAVLVTKDQWRQMQYITGSAPPDSLYPDDDEAMTPDSDDDEPPL